MVKRVISQSKKAVFMAKLVALNQAVANSKAKCQHAWLIIRQTWYIPFLWSLAFHGTAASSPAESSAYDDDSLDPMLSETGISSLSIRIPFWQIL